MIQDNTKKITSCYFIIKNFELDTYLENDELNSNFMSSIVKKLKNDYCGKCYNNLGFIDEIIDIEKPTLENNFISFETLNAYVYFKNLKTNLIVYRPQVNDNIIVNVVKLTPKGLNCENGPLKLNITFNNINTELFDIGNSNVYYKPTSQKIDIKSFLIVNLTKITIKQNLPFIYSECFLLDMITEESIIKKYFYNKEIIIN